MQEPVSKRERSGPSAIVAAVLLLTPLAYLFSTGPVHWLLKRGYISHGVNQGLFWLYTPIRILDESSETFNRLLTWWLSFWN